MLISLKAFVQQEQGATMVEYGLMVAFIALVCFGAVGVLGQGVQILFADVNTALTLE